MQTVDRRYGTAFKSNNRVAFLQSGNRCRAARFHFYDQNTLALRQLVKTGYSRMERHILSGNTNRAASNPAFLNQPGGHELGGVARDGKANSLRRAE